MSVTGGLHTNGNNNSNDMCGHEDGLGIIATDRKTDNSERQKCPLLQNNECNVMINHGDSKFRNFSDQNRKSLPSSSSSASEDGTDDIGFLKGDNLRGSWGNKLEFFLAIMGYTVGVGSIWRFPIICRYYFHYFRFIVLTD